MGGFVEFASAWSKQLLVHRSQQGAKDGLRDRAKKRGLPVTSIPPYGFRFLCQEPGVKRVPIAPEPDPATYHIAVRIWHMAADDDPMRRVASELAQASIPAPKGGPTWNPSTIGYVGRRETELVGLRLRGTVSDEALDRNAALLQAEGIHYQEEIDRQQAALATPEQSEAAVMSLRPYARGLSTV